MFTTSETRVLDDIHMTTNEKAHLDLCSLFKCKRECFLPYAIAYS